MVHFLRDHLKKQPMFQDSHKTRKRSKESRFMLILTLIDTQPKNKRNITFAHFRTEYKRTKNIYMSTRSKNHSTVLDINKNKLKAVRLVSLKKTSPLLENHRIPNKSNLKLLANYRIPNNQI